jgi:hypothetical protein
MIDVDVDTSGLEAALAEFSKLTRKDLGEVTKQQAGILVGHVIAITPPGSGRGQAMTDSAGIDLAAKKRGEARIAEDISKLFVTTRLPEGAIEKLINDRDFQWENPMAGGRKVLVYQRANSQSDLAIVHARARNPRNGRTRQAGGGLMAIARSAQVKAYIKTAIKKVGLLNAGWLNAARELKTASRAVPAWITRHGSQGGGADVRDSGPGVRVRIFNTQTWFPSGMEARVALAVRRREHGLKKAMEAILERRARAAEKRQGR